ncbi:hypothetical protein LCGC14_1706560 [marine sediment metagenome]|uniref:Uncharacterized protein n=1 Tax=marine sediment metagenome TaxID=412755 RepID=A0A0F9HFZ2_9ZZZZ
MKKITITLDTESDDKRIIADLKHHLEKESMQDPSNIKSIKVEDVE